ncbi:hypothetical protein AB5N19_01346 [Seiridium cardinale]
MSEMYDGLAVGIGLFLSDALQAQEPWFLVPRRWSAPDERPKSPGVPAQGIFSTLVDVITFANGATRPWVCLAWRISANAKRMLVALCDSIPLRLPINHSQARAQCRTSDPEGSVQDQGRRPVYPVLDVHTGGTWFCWAFVDGGALDLCLPDLGIVAASSAAYSSNSMPASRS